MGPTFFATTVRQIHARTPGQVCRALAIARGAWTPRLGATTAVRQPGGVVSLLGAPLAVARSRGMGWEARNGGIAGTGQPPAGGQVSRVRRGRRNAAGRRARRPPWSSPGAATTRMVPRSVRRRCRGRPGVGLRTGSRPRQPPSRRAPVDRFGHTPRTCPPSDGPDALASPDPGGSPEVSDPTSSAAPQPARTPRPRKTPRPTRRPTPEPTPAPTPEPTPRSEPDATERPRRTPPRTPARPPAGSDRSASPSSPDVAGTCVPPC